MPEIKPQATVAAPAKPVESKHPVEAALGAKFPFVEVSRVDLKQGVMHGALSSTSIRGRKLAAADKLKGIDGDLFYCPEVGVVVLNGKKGLVVIPVANCSQILI